jgi:hypothetical protein
VTAIVVRYSNPVPNSLSRQPAAWVSVVANLTSVSAPAASGQPSRNSGQRSRTRDRARSIVRVWVKNVVSAAHASPTADSSASLLTRPALCASHPSSPPSATPVATAARASS